MKLLIKICNKLDDYMLFMTRIFNPSGYRALMDNRKEIEELELLIKRVEELGVVADNWRRISDESLILAKDAINNGDLMLYHVYIQQYMGALTRYEEEYTNPFNNLTDNIYER